MSEDGKSTVRAVERALDILLCFTSRNEWAMTEIADNVGLHKSTVHRMLATLEDRGFVARDSASDRYRLGLRIWELSANMSGADDPAVISLPEMELLGETLGETISLYLRDGNERIRIQAVQSAQAVRRVAPVGARMPLYVGASSKVLIAFEEIAKQEELLADGSWPDSFDKELYREQLEEIRKLGYATSIEEREQGAAAVSAPIFTRAGKLVAALSVSGPASRLTLQKMREQAPAIIEAASRLGAMLK
ncbi:IclR family transcriptional regulator [Paenibacillus baekrokdamisoli]|uniref:Glycerol operon regulatory protein n=1 Tax=Paenibacillus baekrokdamisoli TaxID=1712516 RepID=A0A3G9JI49_9BACL|nr:IclR family transcriptional regulator [Paenibacillus baekrokdamisoli]MBB3068269.1 DNA-binding IclR family transcriptional regulator [Paenibacillus baekrokdamisoli]BBH22689.1 IclR family transcriptional regulator [Paenibacillus baekrokdamisoli]